MSPTQYAKSFVSKPSRCGNGLDKHVLKEVFIAELHESVHSMRSYSSTHAGATLYDLARDGTSLRALQKRTEVSSDKGFEWRRILKYRRGRWASAPGCTNLGQ